MIIQLRDSPTLVEISEWFNAPHNSLQIEPRVLAHMSKDPLLQRPYLKGGDLYVESAVKIYGERYDMQYEQFLEADDVTWRSKGLPKHPRKMLKQGLLATIYETSGFGLSTMLDISVEDGEQFITDFHENFPTAHQYAKDSIEFVDNNSFCLTRFGRKRRFAEYSFTDKKTGERVNVPRHSDLAKSYHQLSAQAEAILGHPVNNVWQEDLPYKLKQQLGWYTRFYNKNVRMIVNARTQGSAAEIMKIAMIKMFKLFKELGDEFELIGTLHDEVLLLIPENSSAEVFSKIEEAMVTAVKLDVPLKTDIAVMKRWAEDVTLAEWLQKGTACFNERGFAV